MSDHTDGLCILIRNSRELAPQFDAAFNRDSDPADLAAWIDNIVDRDNMHPLVGLAWQRLTEDVDYAELLHDLTIDQPETESEKWVITASFAGCLPEDIYVIEGEREDAVFSALYHVDDDQYDTAKVMLEDVDSDGYSRWDDESSEYSTFYVSIKRYDPNLHSELESD